MIKVDNGRIEMKGILPNIIIDMSALVDTFVETMSEQGFTKEEIDIHLQTFLLCAMEKDGQKKRETINKLIEKYKARMTTTGDGNALADFLENIANSLRGDNDGSEK